MFQPFSLALLATAHWKDFFWENYFVSKYIPNKISARLTQTYFSFLVPCTRLQAALLVGLSVRWSQFARSTQLMAISLVSPLNWISFLFNYEIYKNQSHAYTAQNCKSLIADPCRWYVEVFKTHLFFENWGRIELYSSKVGAIFTLKIVFL